MKNRKTVNLLQRCAGFVFGACLLLGTQAFAQSAPPGGPPPPPQSSTPGEEVTSLPSMAGHEGGGFRLTGTPLDLQAALRSVAGKGRIEVSVGEAPGTFEVVFHGTFEIELDPQAMGRVALGFQVRSFEVGGHASFGFFGAQQTSFPLDELYMGMDVPIDMFLGEPAFEGHGFQIGALHPERGFVFGACEFHSDSIRLGQIGGRF